MSAVSNSLDELIQPLIDRFIELLPLLVAVVVAFGLAVWGYTFLHNRLARLRQRRREWKLNGGKWHLFQPRSWFPIDPVEYFGVKHDLLKNEIIRTTYAPAEKFTRDLREKERAWKLAWLSPFNKAVIASVSDTTTPKGKKLDARKQVRAAAKAIRVSDLPPGVFVGNPKKDIPDDETEKQKATRIKREEADKRANHFRVDLDYMGKDPNTIARLQGVVQTAAAGKTEVFDSDSPIGLTLIVHRRKVIDPLTQTKVGAAFLREHKATSPYDLVLGIKQDGSPYHFLTHHTMILGASGSGKGSPIQATIMQLAQFVKEGTVQIYASDGKRAEFALYNAFPSPLMKRIALGATPDDLRQHAEIISELLRIIDERSRNAALSIDEGAVEDGRDFTATKKTPMIMYFIDEYPSLYLGFEKMGKDGKIPLAELEQVISLGRSFGVYIMVATQRGEMSMLSPIRPNITNPILFRQPSDHMNRLFLGDDSILNGYDSRKIPPSTKPDYATAGIGYTLDELGNPVKMRVAYTNKDDMAALIREFRSVDSGELERFKREDAERRRLLALEGGDEDGDDGGFTVSVEEQDDELPDLNLVRMDD